MRACMGTTRRGESPCLTEGRQGDERGDQDPPTFPGLRKACAAGHTVDGTCISLAACIHSIVVCLDGQHGDNILPDIESMPFPPPATSAVRLREQFVRDMPRTQCVSRHVRPSSLGTEPSEEKQHSNANVLQSTSQQSLSHRWEWISFFPLGHRRPSRLWPAGRTVVLILPAQRSLASGCDNWHAILQKHRICI